MQVNLAGIGLATGVPGKQGEDGAPDSDPYVIFPRVLFQGQMRIP
jgi:hypothetical protein